MRFQVANEILPLHAADKAMDSRMTSWPKSCSSASTRLASMTNSIASFAFELVRKVNKSLSSQRFTSVEEAVSWLLEVERIRNGEKTATVS